MEPHETKLAQLHADRHNSAIQVPWAWRNTPTNTFVFGNRSLDFAYEYRENQALLEQNPETSNQPITFGHMFLRTVSKLK